MKGDKASMKAEGKPKPAKPASDVGLKAKPSKSDVKSSVGKGGAVN